MNTKYFSLRKRQLLSSRKKAPAPPYYRSQIKSNCTMTAHLNTSAKKHMNNWISFRRKSKRCVISVKVRRPLLRALSCHRPEPQTTYRKEYPVTRLLTQSFWVNYRQVVIHKQQGMQLDRSSLANWMIRFGDCYNHRLICYRIEF